MEDELKLKRSQVIILVAATVVIFVGMVWAIAALRPWKLLGVRFPTATRGVFIARNCTNPLSYWMDHPEMFPPRLVIGGVAYEQEELEALFADDSGDLALQLKAQLAAVFLNGQSGADQSQVESIVFEAYSWLVQHPPGTALTPDDQDFGSRLYAALEAYNLGLAGVASCNPQAALTSTRIVGLTSTFTPSPTASLTPTSRAFPTAIELSPSATLFYVTQPVDYPSATLRSTSPPAASNTPVKTKPPSTPTWTPVKPTQTPFPTNTPLPPTPTLTPPPLPTSTFTPPPLPTFTLTPLPTLTIPPPPKPN